MDQNLNYGHVTLNYNEKSVNMKSLMGVLSLGIPHKAKIEIVVEGEDEGTAMDMIVEKIKSLEISIFTFFAIIISPFLYIYYSTFLLI